MICSPTNLITIVVESLPVVTTVVIVVEEFLVDLLVGLAVAEVAAAALGVMDILVKVKPKEQSG